MENYNFKISITLDNNEYETLNKAITLYRISNALLDYAMDVETCEAIEGKLKKNIKIIKN